MADKKSTVALCLQRAPHLRRFSSQAAPGKNLGDSPPRVLDSFALDWNAFQSANPSALGHPWTAGSKAEVQAWYRDPPASKTTNLSNAVELTYSP